VAVELVAALGLVLGAVVERPAVVAPLGAVRGADDPVGEVFPRLQVLEVDGEVLVSVPVEAVGEEPVVWDVILVVYG
jgi:hypothetical protein